MWAQRPAKLVDDQRAIRLGMAIRMAGMIGLQYSKGPQSGQRDERLTRNDLRLRLCLILQESRLVYPELLSCAAHVQMGVAS